MGHDRHDPSRVLDRSAPNEAPVEQAAAAIAPPPPGFESWHAYEARFGVPRLLPNGRTNPDYLAALNAEGDAEIAAEASALDEAEGSALDEAEESGCEAHGVRICLVCHLRDPQQHGLQWRRLRSSHAASAHLDDGAALAAIRRDLAAAETAGELLARARAAWTPSLVSVEGIDPIYEAVRDAHLVLVGVDDPPRDVVGDAALNRAIAERAAALRHIDELRREVAQRDNVIDATLADLEHERDERDGAIGTGLRVIRERDELRLALKGARAEVGLAEREVETLRGGAADRAEVVRILIAEADAALAGHDAADVTPYVDAREVVVELLGDAPAEGALADQVGIEIDLDRTVTLAVDLDGEVLCAAVRGEVDRAVRAALSEANAHSLRVAVEACRQRNEARVAAKRDRRDRTDALNNLTTARQEADGLRSSHAATVAEAVAVLREAHVEAMDDKATPAAIYRALVMLVASTGGAVSLVEADCSYADGGHSYAPLCGRELLGVASCTRCGHTSGAEQCGHRHGRYGCTADRCRYGEGGVSP
jgi:hypothetical protein